MPRAKRTPPKLFPERDALDWLITEADNYAGAREDHFRTWTFMGFVADEETFAADCDASFRLLTRDAAEWLLSCGHTASSAMVADVYEQLSRDAARLDQVLGVGADSGPDDDEHRACVLALAPAYKGHLADFARRLWQVKDLVVARADQAPPSATSLEAAGPDSWRWEDLPASLEKIALALQQHAGKKLTCSALKSAMGETKFGKEPSRILGRRKKTPRWARWIERYIGHEHRLYWWIDPRGVQKRIS